MNVHLQKISDYIQQDQHLSADEKAALLKSIKDTDSALAISEFKLERTEKVKRTTAILLEETIEELEQKRKAVEAQNRELEIESSLERVRAVAMSMMKAEDMLEVCKTISQQLELLNVKEIRNVQTAIFYNEKRTYMSYEYYSKHNQTFVTETTYTNNEIHETWARNMLTGSGELFITNINGDEVKEWIAYQKTTNVFIDDYLYTASSLNYYWFSLGVVSLGISTYIALTEDEMNLFKRFVKVFELAYRRYLDIEKAEAQAREAKIETALEKVRSRTMAMQHSDELADASFVLDSQVRALGIQTRGCAFNIYGENESTEWFSSEFGTLPTYQTPRENLFLRYYEIGQRGEQLYIEKFEGEACTEHYQYLCTIPIMGDALRDMIASGGSFPEMQIDHVAYFKYGYLLFITLEPVPNAHEIFIRFAKVFEQTYTRFLDLQKAEAQTVKAEQDLIEIIAARKKAEETLSELQITQKQLIQSEKMASLGELTAGIAHEIQNPLNFVNNFSDVSIELLDEMSDEISKGDIEEALAIAIDVKQNLEKIAHHGKRADSIVKGMLQHSRTTSGQKEPTDINALTDEYLRLAYHGLRAKDKSFNAEIITNFDGDLPKVDVLPQDIGRVLLNLFTNAFYATQERKKADGENFKPTVEVSTLLSKNNIEIQVKDNGNGIPDAIKEKIFQPFFTTKPTGQGTGLGLSLSYDIVMAHGGELNVRTKDSEGTAFIISLPK